MKDFARSKKGKKKKQKSNIKLCTIKNNNDSINIKLLFKLFKITLKLEIINFLCFKIPPYGNLFWNQITSLLFVFFIASHPFYQDPKFLVRIHGGHSTPDNFRETNSLESFFRFFHSTFYTPRHTFEAHSG